MFDHLGGGSVRRSYRMLAPGGTLVSYGMATRRDDRTPMTLLFLPLLTRLAIWNYLPNGRHATFYNVWGGSRRRTEQFWTWLHADLGEVLTLLKDGVLTPEIAARLPLAGVSAAMELAESHAVVGTMIPEP